MTATPAMIDERIGHERQPAKGEKALLAAIEQRRTDLTRDVLASNPALSRSDVDYCVRRIVGGSVLLRICEQRGLEDRDGLLALANRPDVYGRLRKQLQRADARYKAAARDGLPPGLQIDDHTLGSFLRALYPPQGEEIFRALPADILGRLHERSLGEIKAGGVFYTPSHVVDCIVEWTVGKLLEGKTAGQVAGLRIVDPACGGGAFLLGAYAYLLDWYLDFYTSTNAARRSRGAPPVVVEAPGGDWKLTTTERQRILTAHVFGVDIDAEAVETTKLSLQLKALAAGTEVGTEATASLQPGHCLPDLGDNIKCGNSLLGPDYVRHASLRGDDAGRRANPFDWHAEFAAVFEAGGFHAVIGNPPYGAALSELERQWLAHRF